MQISDVIADMLTRIRNANAAKHETVDIPNSNMKRAIAQILLDEGYIKGFEVVDNFQGHYDRPRCKKGKRRRRSARFRLVREG